jgi:hypothetical protein
VLWPSANAAEAIKRAIIEELRDNDGSRLRALLRVLRDSSNPDAKGLYERLIRNPALRDLVPTEPPLVPIMGFLGCRRFAVSLNRRSDGRLPFGEAGTR